MRGVFVTGTDTGSGKTVVAAAICAALAARGEPVAPFKPVVTGLDDPPQPPWTHDHRVLAAAAGAGARPEDVAPYRFGPPVSPHYAAELSGTRIEPARLVQAARRRSAGHATVCEGVGGLMVPLTPGYLVRDLALELELPLVIAARCGLGTINHSLLSVEAARAVGLRVAAIVMTPWTADPTPLERSNRSTVERLTGVPVVGLEPTAPASLTEAGAELPLDDWIDRPS